MADPNPENVQDLLARAHGIINNSEPKTEAAICADERERLAKAAEGWTAFDQRNPAHGDRNEMSLADWIRSRG